MNITKTQIVLAWLFSSLCTVLFAEESANKTLVDSQLVGGWMLKLPDPTMEIFNEYEPLGKDGIGRLKTGVMIYSEGKLTGSSSKEESYEVIDMNGDGKTLLVRIAGKNGERYRIVRISKDGDEMEYSDLPIPPGPNFNVDKVEFKWRGERVKTEATPTKRQDAGQDDDDEPEIELRDVDDKRLDTFGRKGVKDHNADRNEETEVQKDESEAGQVKAAFEAYKQAILTSNGEAAASCLVPETHIVFDRLRKLALSGTKNEIQKLNLSHQVIVIELRHQLDCVTLQGMDGLKTLVYCLKNELISDRRIMEIRVDKVVVDGDSATAVLFQGPIPSGIVVNFKRVQGKWKYSLDGAVESMDKILRSELEKSGWPIEKFLIEVATDVEDESRGDGIDIWKLPKE
ncbi:MAG: hypothetical protein AB7F75_03505 [Planctomycetota bacterium]